ncbi:MAG: hypothetical protein ACKVTZ_09505 [Bacteroidia bacterium]
MPKNEKEIVYLYSCKSNELSILNVRLTITPVLFEEYHKDWRKISFEYQVDSLLKDSLPFTKTKELAYLSIENETFYLLEETYLTFKAVYDTLKSSELREAMITDWGSYFMPVRWFCPAKDTLYSPKKLNQRDFPSFMGGEPMYIQTCYNEKLKENVYEYAVEGVHIKWLYFHPLKGIIGFELEGRAYPNQNMPPNQEGYLQMVRTYYFCNCIR